MDMMQKAILETIDILIQQRLRELKFNYYVSGKITAVNVDGTYKVLINDNESDIKARDGLSLQIGDIVLVLIVNGNYSDKIIDMKRP